MKPRAAFARNLTKHDGRQTYCASCYNLRHRAYYAKNRRRMRKQIRAANQRRRHEVIRRFLEYLSDKECRDCGESDPLVLEFDHVRGKKVAEITRMIADGYSWLRIRREIDKCEIRCANCHRRATARRGRFYRVTFAALKVLPYAYTERRRRSSTGRAAAF